MSAVHDSVKTSNGTYRITGPHSRDMRPQSSTRQTYWKIERNGKGVDEAATLSRAQEKLAAIVRKHAQAPMTIRYGRTAR